LVAGDYRVLLCGRWHKEIVRLKPDLLRTFASNLTCPTVVTIEPDLPVDVYSENRSDFAKSGYVSHIVDRRWKIGDAGSFCTVVRAGAFLIDQRPVGGVRRG
jgi:hypothetical protein